MHRHDAGCFVHTFPLFRFMRWYAYHACLCHLLALYASLHACLHVHAWVLLASVSLACQRVVHASTQWSYGHPIQTYICPPRTPPSVCFLACLPFCLYACFLAPLLAMPIMLTRFMPFHMLFASFPSIACLLVSCLYLCMYTHGERTLGARA